MPTYKRDGLQLWYEEHGTGGGPPLVLLHGVLLSSRMQARLADRLPELRVFLLDHRGHGRSGSSRDPAAYDLATFASDVLGFLDHAGLDRVVLGGMSLGANVTLQVALRAPDRLAGMVLEMPVFARGERAGRLLFGATARLLAGAAPLLDVTRPVGRRLPVPGLLPEVGWLKDLVVGDHRANAAMLRGLLRESITLAEPETLRRVATPALVVAHGSGGRLRDPVHVLDDALDVAEFLPNARVVRPYSFIDNRVAPERLALAVNDFVHEVFQPGVSRAAGN